MNTHIKIQQSSNRIKIVTNGRFFSLEKEFDAYTSEYGIFAKERKTEFKIWIPLGDPRSLTDFGGSLPSARKLYDTLSEAEEAAQVAISVWKDQEKLREWKEVRIYE